MQQVGRVHKLERLQQLPHDVLFVDVLQYVMSNRRVQICLHVLEDEVEVAIVVRLHHV